MTEDPCVAGSTPVLPTPLSTCPTISYGCRAFLLTLVWAKVGQKWVSLCACQAPIGPPQIPPYPLELRALMRPRLRAGILPPTEIASLVWETPSPSAPSHPGPPRAICGRGFHAEFGRFRVVPLVLDRYTVARLMQHHCGDVKNDMLLQEGLRRLNALRQTEGMRLVAQHPHDLMRCLEVLNILTNAEIILQSCLARKAPERYLHFKRSDADGIDPQDWRCFVTVRKQCDDIVTNKVSLDYYGSLSDQYQRHHAGGSS
jgi:hypothetical protein